MVSRYYYTDLRRIGKRMLSLLLQRCLIWNICFIPGIVRNLLRLKPFVKTDPELPGTIMLQLAKPFLDGIWRQLLQKTPPLDLHP